MDSKDNRVLRWLVYNLAWWIVKREIRAKRRKFIAAGAIAGVLVGGLLLAARSRSD